MKIKVEDSVKHLYVKLATTENLNCKYVKNFNGVGDMLTFENTNHLYIDSVLCEKNDVVLIKDQTNIISNGIYELFTSEDEDEQRLIRHENYDKTCFINRRDIIHVTDGEINSNTEWKLAFTRPARIGRDPIFYKRYLEE